jgi:uncharacterized repeat protein (TIGR03899 family)
MNYSTLSKIKKNNERYLTMEKSGKETSVLTDSSNKIKAVATVIVAPETSGQNKKNDASSYLQLLHLAQNFALDVAMIADDKKMPIEDRARKRERLSHLRKQKNMEDIIQKTLAYCSEGDVVNQTNQDWFNSFTSLAEGISNNTMQDLWAKILAGEIYQPGSYSLKALQVFRNMSLGDAKLLAKACSLAIKDQSRKSLRLISGCYQKPSLFNMFDKNRQKNISLSPFGLNYSDLLALAENHLLFIQESETNLIEKNELLKLNYNGISFSIAAKKANCILRFYKFTPIGMELAHLIGDKPMTSYHEALKQQLSYHFTMS